MFDFNSCNGIAFASPAIADLYANIQGKQAEDALKSFAKSADKVSRPAKDSDDDASDKSAAKLAAQAKENWLNLPTELTYFISRVFFAMRRPRDPCPPLLVQ
jgi:hypothetical protein